MPNIIIQGFGVRNPALIETKMNTKSVQKEKFKRKSTAKSFNKSVTKNLKKINKLKYCPETLKEINSENDTANSSHADNLTIPIPEVKKLKSSTNTFLLDRKYDSAQEAATVFVGNLPPNTKKKDVAKFFQTYDPIVSVRLRTSDGKLIAKHSERKECVSLIAYVVLQDEESANNALCLNGTLFKGNFVRVTKANSEDIKNSIYQNKNYQKRTVFVGNIKNKVTDDTLREVFSSCGDVEYVRTFPKKNMGCAFVCFKLPESVGLALELQNTIVDGRPIRVNRYKLNIQEKNEHKNGSAIIVHDINDSTPVEEVRRKFSKHGPIDNIELIDNKGKLSALVRYKNSQSAMKATKLRNVMLNGSCVTVASHGKDKPKVEKKNVYRGKTMTGFKKNEKSFKKKKTTNHMDNIAKLIAPRE